MGKRLTRRDPIESEIELALTPGVYTHDRECFSFVTRLEGVAAQIEQLQKTDPGRAARLSESFLAGCKEKAEELDDSSGGFGQFAQDLICRWIKATQAADADPDNTAATLLGWMDNDPFCYQIEKDVAKALDKAGLAAFERLIRARFESNPSEERYDQRRWGGVLRAIYVAQRNPSAYEVIAEEIGLEPRDCLAMATLLVARTPDLALDWVDRGIELDRKAPQGSAAGYALARLRRELLTNLGRGDEAIDAAWTEYRKSPSRFSFDDLMKVVPKAERAVWLEKALDAAKGADLHSVMELLVETRETGPPFRSEGNHQQNTNALKFLRPAFGELALSEITSEAVEAYLGRSASVRPKNSHEVRSAVAREDQTGDSTPGIQNSVARGQAEAARSQSLRGRRISCFGQKINPEAALHDGNRTTEDRKRSASLLEEYRGDHVRDGTAV